MDNYGGGAGGSGKTIIFNANVKFKGNVVEDVKRAFPGLDFSPGSVMGFLVERISILEKEVEALRTGIAIGLYKDKVQEEPAPSATGSSFILKI